MSDNKIDARHTDRLAFVYIRQSSPSAVRKHVEGAERQRRMLERVEGLGWPSERIRVLSGDTGKSGSTLHGRDDFQDILESVLDGSAGIVCAREVSRLARDNQDWAQLMRLCRHRDVLLCDEHKVYEVNDPQDRVLLGIQGAFSEFELALITDRMQKSLQQKRERGELYVAFPPGYVCRHAPLYEKHPDARVQHAVENVFQKYDGVTSVLALYRALVKADVKLPMVPHGRDWREVEWRPPSYYRLIGMLRNPVYAGYYVDRRSKTITELDAEGNIVKKKRLLPPEEWQLTEDHHEAYISKDKWKKNMTKIGNNARSSKGQRAPASGVSLLAGLLRCRRCNCRFHVHYSSSSTNSSVQYVCRRGAQQRRANGTCLLVPGTRIDSHVGQLLLEVVRPAALEASLRAAEVLALDHQNQRQLVVDQLTACQECEVRAEREYKATDETYTSVRGKLASEWNQAIEGVARQQERLDKFDCRSPLAPTKAELDKLSQMHEKLEDVWQATDANQLRKQIARTLIQDVLVDVDEESNEIVLLIHWSGGHHTEHHMKRRRPSRRVHVADLKSVFESLRKILPDTSIATALNRERIDQSHQDPNWTKQRVQRFRKQHEIKAFSKREKQKSGWLTQQETATRLNISPMSVSRLVHAGIIHAEQPYEGLPMVICENEIQSSDVQKQVARLKSSNNRPLPDDPKQLSLFTTTKS